MYDEIYEGYFEDTSAKDGGVIFQAILSHDISWKIVDGNTVFDQNNIKTRLHTVEVFPDLNYKKGEASSVYHVLSEVNILKRKFDMASKAIKSTKPSKQILTEGDQLANRFKKLAGIV